MRNSAITLLIIICASLKAMAQYQFDSKKAEKLYNKLEEYYADGDYGSILDNEDKIDELFLSKKDTLGALMLSFLGEGYLYWDNDLQTALDYFQREYDLRKELGGDGSMMQNVIFNLGYVQDELGYYGKTEDIYLELLELEKRDYGDDSEEYFISASSLLDHYVFVEEWQKGLDLAKALRKKRRKEFIQ